jgi:hypothetical protein
VCTSQPYLVVGLGSELHYVVVERGEPSVVHSREVHGLYTYSTCVHRPYYIIGHMYLHVHSQSLNHSAQTKLTIIGRVNRGIIDYFQHKVDSQGPGVSSVKSVVASQHDDIWESWVIGVLIVFCEGSS